MHKPLFFLVISDSSESAKLDAESSLDELINKNDSIDWYQGIKESQRWPNYEKFDKPQRLSKIESVLRKMLRESEEYALDWIKKGNEELDDYLKNPRKTKNTLSWVLTNFSIASSGSPCHVFDLTNWSNDYVVSNKDFDAILKYIREQKQITSMWVVGFDVHY